MARITIDVDLPPEVEITGYQRYQDGHGLEVRWPLPARCRCEKCGHDDVAHIEFKTIPQVIRDLNLWEQPCFWIYQAPFHRCARCNYRQHIIPPFKRKDVSYTYRFEQFVLRSPIGSTAEEVARRLGISAETVDRIVENQLTADRQIDPQRVITDIGLDELSLKKRHRLDVTLMTDLSDPTRPQILAVERGRDTTATLKCLDRLTQEQRQQVRTHRVDMGPAYPAACALRLPHSRAVTDRFHVAKKFNEVVDSLRKNITREYKAKLTKDQRKAFRSQMWAFRRDPESLSAEEKQALEALFEKIPALRPLYKVRLRFKEIFDTARDRITAGAGGRDQQQGPGDHQAYLWTEVSEESVGPIDPGLESGVASDRLLDRAHPPDGQGPEGPIRLVLHLKTEEPYFCSNLGGTLIRATAFSRKPLNCPSPLPWSCRLR